MRFQAAIIDLDGTMIDTLGDFEAALNAMLAELGLPVASPEFVGRSVGKGTEHLLRTVLARQLALSGCAPAESEGLARQLYAQAWPIYERHYLAINGRYSTIFTGVVAGLSLLAARGLRLACLTNKPLLFARPLLEQKGLRHYFARVYGGDSFERKKPDPLPVLKTCEALGYPPSATLVIGDSSNDAQAARSAGCEVVLMTYGYNHGEPIRATPALAWLDSLADVLPTLDSV